MINRFLFSQINLDSSALTVLDPAIHRFTEPGKYYGEIQRGTETVGKFSIQVHTTVESANKAQMASSIKIDLKKLDLPASEQLKSQTCNCFTVPVGGYAVFFVSTGTGGYKVQITKSGADQCNAKVFDSSELKAQDLFVATILRPGTYQITNTLTKAKAQLRVMYPEVGRTPRQSPAVNVECSEKTITPNEIKINPAQPLVFCFKVPSSIKIELIKPEDRPQNEATQTVKTAIQQGIQVKPKKAIRHLQIR